MNIRITIYTFKWIFLSKEMSALFLPLHVSVPVIKN
jgi:hypothetical protein